MITAYYNEIDEYAAQWLINLIDAGHITPGDVDTRSIADVSPDDVRGYDRVHFFAGIGVWDYALNRAGWREGQVWTGSCPCQPFSVAGKGDGFTDTRHLWPEMERLIKECGPLTVFGEQVASKDGYAWLDLIQTDLEGTGYTVGAVVAPAAGFGAPHQRHRMYWVADASNLGCVGRRSSETRDGGTPRIEPERLRNVGGLADTLQSGWTSRRTESGSGQIAGGGLVSGLADTDSRECYGVANGEGCFPNGQTTRREQSNGELECRGTNGFWSDAEWIYCRDEKYRPVKSSIFPLAHGVARRVGKLRAAGNAICAPQAEEFIKAYLEVRP